MTPDLALAALAFAGILFAVWHLPMAAHHLAQLVERFKRGGGR